MNGDPRMIRGRELLAVGAFDEAFIEFEEIVDAVRENGDILGSYRMAIYLRGLGIYRESIIAAADVIVASSSRYAACAAIHGSYAFSRVLH